MKGNIVFSLCTDDIQQVAADDLDRHLSDKELRLVADRVGDYLDWYQAIGFAIQDLKMGRLGDEKLGAGEAAAKKPAARKAK